MLTSFHAQDASLIGTTQTKRFRTSFGTKQKGRPYSANANQTLILQNEDLVLREGGGLSSFGDPRCANEDAIFVDPYGAGGVFDGAGGHDNAAATALGAASSAHRQWRAVMGRTLGNDSPSVQPLLRTDKVHPQDVVRRVMNAAYQGAISGGKGKGKTTAAFVYFTNNVKKKTTEVWFSNVGDSRIYMLSSVNGRLYRLSTDDSLLTRLVESKQITSADAHKIDQATDEARLSDEEWGTFNMRNGITHSLSTGEPFKKLNLHVGRENVSAGDKILIVCDGITDNLPDSIIEDLLYRYEGWDIVAKLMAQADAWATSASVRAKTDDMSAVVFENL